MFTACLKKLKRKITDYLDMNKYYHTIRVSYLYFATGSRKIGSDDHTKRNQWCLWKKFEMAQQSVFRTLARR